MEGREHSAYPVTGTLIWYYAICPREAWLMAHQLEPYPDHELLELGRLLQEVRYPRFKKEVNLPGMKVDLLSREGTAFVLGEVKRTSRDHHAHRLQLGYYLWRFKALGLNARGELRYPQERKVVPVELDEALEAEVNAAIEGLKRLLAAPVPPPAVRIPECPKCAYYEFCWVEEA